MKKHLSLIVASILISTSVYAMPGITKDTKKTTSTESSGSKTFNKSNVEGKNESRTKSRTFDESKTLSNSKSWAKTISKNKGYSLTKSGTLTINLDLLPIVQNRVGEMFPRSTQIKFARNVFLSDIGFRGISGDGVVSPQLYSYYTDLANTNSNVNDWDAGTDKHLKIIMISVYMMGEIVNEVAIRLKNDDSVTVYNLNEKIDEKIEEAVKYTLKRYRNGFYDMPGACYFASPKAWSCDDRKYVLELDGGGRPTLQEGNFVIFGRGLVLGKSLSMNLALGKTLSEGLQLVSADSKNRGNAFAAKKALSLVKTKGKTKNTTIALSKTLNKIVKESGDQTINRTLSTNPIK